MTKSYLLPHKNPGEEHCLVGSLTGEVASKSVTEAYKGWLTLNGNQGLSCKRDKPAWLRDVQVEQGRKSVLVILGSLVGGTGLNG